MFLFDVTILLFLRKNKTLQREKKTLEEKTMTLENTTGEMSDVFSQYKVQKSAVADVIFLFYNYFSSKNFLSLFQSCHDIF